MGAINEESYIACSACGRSSIPRLHGEPCWACHEGYFTKFWREATPLATPVSIRLERWWKDHAWLPQKWQDIIFALGEIVFLVSLFPSIFSDQKPSPWTSFATAFMLYLFLLVHRSYGLWWAFALCFVTATLWVVLGVQAL